jgi:sialic acid synthase
MFKAAADAGADAVKLQKRENRTLYSDDFYASPYNSENAFGDTYGAHREALEFSRTEYIILQEVAATLGITFFATAFDIPSANFLA